MEPRRKPNQRRSQRAQRNVDAAVRYAATKFRTMMEQIEKANLPEPWRDFPRGSCDLASQVLGRFLCEMLGIAVTTVYGERDFPDLGHYTHRWLDCESLTVDVTADQFGQSPVIVSRDSPWHQGFHGIKQIELTEDAQWFKSYCATVLARFEEYIASAPSS
jgi:hypothetical protein